MIIQIRVEGTEKKGKLSLTNHIFLLHLESMEKTLNVLILFLPIIKQILSGE